MNNLQPLNVKKCGHCNKMKPATAEFFSANRGSPSGLQSWCKECTNKKYNDPILPINPNNELVELYILAYLEGYNKSTNPRYGGKTREAREYAYSVCPQIPPAIKSYGRTVAAGKQVSTQDEQLGLLALTGIRKLNLKRDFYKDNVTTPKRQITLPIPEIQSTPVTAVDLYQKWIEENDFVPNDAVLSHFAGLSRGAFINGRRKATESGYILEQRENGWIVTKRPVKEKTLDEMSKDEVVILLKKLLEVK